MKIAGKDVTRAIAPGTVFVPMHWGALWAENSSSNALTHPESCPDSLQKGERGGSAVLGSPQVEHLP
jgi:ferredoxin-nitrate reductase